MTFASGHIQRCEQRRCAVTLVVVRARAGFSKRQWQPRLGAIQGLDRLFSSTHSTKGAIGWCHIQPHPSRTLSTKWGSVDSESLLQMRLPDQTHARCVAPSPVIPPASRLIWRTPSAWRWSACSGEPYPRCAEPAHLPHCGQPAQRASVKPARRYAGGAAAAETVYRRPSVGQSWCRLPICAAQHDSHAQLRPQALCVRAVAHAALRARHRSITASWRGVQGGPSA